MQVQEEQVQHQALQDLQLQEQVEEAVVMLKPVVQQVELVVAELVVAEMQVVLVELELLIQAAAVDRQVQLIQEEHQQVRVVQADLV